MGRRLTEMAAAPHHVISSTALRARTTAELACEAGGWGLDVSLEPRFYGTGPGEVAEVVRAVGGFERLMIVGHQPTWGMLVQALAGESVEMRTATVAIIEFPVDRWSDIAEGNLVAVHAPSSSR
jgi:phosphohistidine phosphatase